MAVRQEANPGQVIPQQETQTDASTVHVLEQQSPQSFDVYHHVRKSTFSEGILFTAQSLTESEDELAPHSFAILQPDEHGKVEFIDNGTAMEVTLRKESTVIEVKHKSQPHFSKFMHIVTKKTIPYLETISQMEALKKEGILNGYFVPPPILSASQNQG